MNEQGLALMRACGRSPRDAGRMSDRLVSRVEELAKETPGPNRRDEFNIIWCEHLAELDEQAEGPNPTPNDE